MSDDPRNFIDSLPTVTARDYAASYYHYVRNGAGEPKIPMGLTYEDARFIRQEIRNLYQGLLCS